MGAPKWPHSKAVRWLIYLAVWTFVALFLISQGVARALYLQQRIPWRILFSVWLTDSYLWALLAPLIWTIAKQLPISRRSWWRAILIHFVFSTVFAVGEAALFALVTTAIGLRIRPTFLATFRMVLPGDFHLNIALYWAIVGIQHAFSVYSRSQERETKAAQLELRASELERQLVQSRLGALRMQLHPHFLFNTLNAIVVLVRQSKMQDADQMLTNLSELLRRTLEEWENQEVPLRTEIEFLRLYLDIERVRFQDRLSIDLAIEPETLGALVPCFLLQPLVENAVRHGVAKTSAGKVALQSRRIGSTLEFQISDDGPGLANPQDAPGNGVGLSNTRARLQQLYGRRQCLELESPEGGGTVATIRIPYRDEAENVE
jgi:two-component system LytT family sensor kinase